MPRLTPRDAEAVTDAIVEALEKLGRQGDVDRMAHRLAQLHASGSTLVGFRRRGREALLFEQTAPDETGELAIYDVSRAGHVTRIGVLDRRVSLEDWLREHRYYLDWVAPRFG
ncbi:hypothetical protein ACFQGT_07855 [Natrialbaceae archaeon GCM10025810]|uniref:hypothetical protein n=1 Tax=Halovalidus salilacus TaxID=3075124 RepID=UPI003615E48D